MHPLFSMASAALCSILVCQTAVAGSSGSFLSGFSKAYEQGKTSHIFDVDNDSLLLRRDDGLYTSGLRYTQQYLLEESAKITVHGWRIGQELYTPSNINLPPALVGPPDHPYAGWLYGGAFKETHHADGTYRKIGVDIGCLGPCAGGEWTQNALHRLLNQPLPRGWSRQIRNEPGIVLHGSIAPVRWTPHANIDITPHLHGRFGNIFTDAGAAVLFRAGQLNTMPGRPAWYGYFRADGRAVGYNATMQGGYFSKDNVHTVKPKRFVGEMEIGFAWDAAPYGVRLGIVRRTNEVENLPNFVGSQNFARFQFSYTP